MMVKGKKRYDLSNEADRVAKMIDSVPMSSESKEEIRKTLTPTMIQFLLRWETGRDLEIEERVIDIVMAKMHAIYQADNECICKNVAESVGKQLAEVLEPWNRRLEGIEQVLEKVEDWQISVDKLHKKMDERISSLEERVYRTDNERIAALEEYASPKKTIFRLSMAGLAIIGIVVILFLFVLNDKMATVEKMLEEHVKREITK